MSKKIKFKSIYEIQDKVPEYIWRNIMELFEEEGRYRYREGVSDGEENVKRSLRDLIDVMSRYDNK